MGTVSTLWYTEGVTTVSMHHGDIILNSGLSLVARWTGSEMTRTTGARNSWHCPLTGIFYFYMAVRTNTAMISGKESSQKNSATYLAVAKMCSYLGDHRTERTSALWPKQGKWLLMRLGWKWWYLQLMTGPLTLKNMNPWSRLQVT